MERETEVDVEEVIEESIVRKTRSDQAPPTVEQLVKLTKGLGIDVDCSCAVALGILCQEMVQAAGLSLFNTVHNQQLGQVAGQAASMKGIIELHRSGAAPATSICPPPRKEAGAAEDATTALLACLLETIQVLRNGNGGNNGNGNGNGGYTPH